MGNVHKYVLWNRFNALRVWNTHKAIVGQQSWHYTFSKCLVSYVSLWAKHSIAVMGSGPWSAASESEVDHQAALTSRALLDEVLHTLKPCLHASSLTVTYTPFSFSSWLLIYSETTNDSKPSRCFYHDYLNVQGYNPIGSSCSPAAWFSGFV